MTRKNVFVCLLLLVYLVVAISSNSAGNDDPGDGGDKSDSKNSSNDNSKNDEGSDDKKDGDNDDGSKNVNENNGYIGCEVLPCRQGHKTCCMKMNRKCVCKCVLAGLLCQSVWPRECPLPYIARCRDKGRMERCSCKPSKVPPANPEQIKKAFSVITNIIPNIPGIPKRFPGSEVLNKLIIL
ncbi:uncharacterized protein [Dermacentor andersoni]|uniref:uncharacterized protein n=1 Tax=Dermacentor andersoni TaxID=34620 RepID=UPI002415F895|nr:uncharacterized protein LOC126534532 [Dermacentor andersoni]